MGFYRIFIEFFFFLKFILEREVNCVFKSGFRKDSRFKILVILIN